MRKVCVVITDWMGPRSVEWDEVRKTVEGCVVIKGNFHSEKQDVEVDERIGSSIKQVAEGVLRNARIATRKGAAGGVSPLFYDTL